MKISTKTRYGLRTMIYIAAQEGTRYIQIKEISKRERISVKYLEQIIQQLKRNDILIVARGAKGGYRLSMPAEKILLKDIFYALEGAPAIVDCQQNGTCANMDFCSTIEVWQGLRKEIDNYLKSITLQQMTEQYMNKHQSNMYYI